MRTFSEWIGATILSLFPKREIAGMWIIFTDVSADRDESVARLRNALTLVAAAGERYKALTERIQRIVVWPGDRTFADQKGGVHIPTAVVIGVSDLALASVLVHESVHLRLSARGIQYKAECRERIERLCIGTQASFLRRTPGVGDTMAEEAEAALAQPWWTAESRKAVTDSLLEQHGVPKWLRSVMPS